jgi:hypothetical protein
MIDSASKIDSNLLVSFDQLPPDDYLQSEMPFRYRAFGLAMMRDGKLDWTDRQEFFQSAAINSYAGGRERRFPPLHTPARVFAERFVGDQKLPLTHRTAMVGCHQIRVVAEDSFNGYPAPEGFHQDGFDWVAITCIEQCNVNGGVSMVSRVDADEEDPLLIDRTIEAGETILLNDRAVRHYVSPITPKLPGRAYRDVIVLTFEEVPAA